MTEPMVQLSKTDVKSVESMLYGIKNGTTKAMVTALNATLTTTRVQVRKKIGERLNLKASRINQNLSVDKASYSKISGAVRAVGGPVGLVHFAGKQLETGVKVRVMKGDGLTLLKHAFRQKASGKEHLWWRDRKNGKLVPRYPIIRLTGPRIEDVFARPEILIPLTNDAGDLLLKNLDKKVSEILRRYHA